jgi:RNA polymerase sigma factor (sigma-70 family)
MEACMSERLTQLDAVFEANRSVLVQRCRRWVPSAPMAEEIVHDTYLVARSRLSSLRSEAALRAWLFGIARRLAWNCVRRRTGQELPLSEVVEDGPSVLDLLIARERSAWLKSSLERTLTLEEQRGIGVWLEAEGTYVAVQSELGMTRKEVHALLVRTRRKLGREAVLAA